MRAQSSEGILVLTPESGEDSAFAEWLAAHAGQVFRLEGEDGTARLHSLGPEAEACREPINITSQSPMPLALASNFAETPFVLDGRHYASIEGFWQGLKFPEDSDRRRLAKMHGKKAKDAGSRAPPADTFVYGGTTIRSGTFDHWQLMERACVAKFSQHQAARDALVSTGTRPIVHQIGPDSRTIPGVIMADIWSRIRQQLC
jgi:predicted NAD-dependent protein-ADP-ribosyltransferase YbiA (DUF1768 family)